MRFTLITFTLVAGALTQSTVHSTATSTTSSSVTVSSTSTSASGSASKTTSSSSASATPSDSPTRSISAPNIPKEAVCALSCLTNVRERFNNGQGCDPTVGSKCMCEDEEVNKQLGRCIQMLECDNETLEYIRDVAYVEERCTPEGLKYNKDAFNAGVQAAGGDLGLTEKEKEADKKNAEEEEEDEEEEDEEEEEGAARKSAVGLGVMAGAAVLAMAVVL